MNNEIVSVGIELDTTSYDNGIQGMEQSTKGLGKSLIGKAGLLFAVTTVAAAFVKMGKIYLDLNKKMYNFEVTLKNTNSELRNNQKELNKTTNRLVATASATGFSLEEIADSQSMARKSGLELNESLNTTSVATTLASKYNLELAETTEAAGGAIKNFGATSDEVYSSFSYILENTNADAGELADVFGELSVFARENGKDINDVTVEYVELVKKGYKAEEAVAALTTSYEKNEKILGDTTEAMKAYESRTVTVKKAQDELELSTDQVHGALVNELALWAKNSKAMSLYKKMMDDLTKSLRAKNEMDVLEEETGLSEKKIKSVKTAVEMYDSYIEKRQYGKANKLLENIMTWEQLYGEAGKKMIVYYKKLTDAKNKVDVSESVKVVDTPKKIELEETKKINKEIEEEEKRHNEVIDKEEKKSKEKKVKNAKDEISLEKFKKDAVIQLERGLERGLQSIYNQAVKNGEINLKNMTALMMAEVGGVAAAGSIEAGVQGMRAIAQSVTMVRPAKTEKRAEAMKSFKLSAKMGAIAGALGVAANAMYDSGESESDGERNDNESNYTDNTSTYSVNEENYQESEVIVVGVEPFVGAVEDFIMNKYNKSMTVTMTAKRRR